MSVPAIQRGSERNDQTMRLAFCPPSSRLGKPPLRTACAQLIKEVVWRTVLSYRPARRAIGLYASRRSGSSLLMEVIAVNPGVMFSDQPFSLFTASSANLNRLPVLPSGQLAGLEPDEEQVVHDYIAGLIAGTIVANAPWKIWSREFHFRNNRICLKITDAKALIDWIDRRFDIDTVVSTRHPIAQAISVAQLGWLTTGRGFLRNESFVNAWLDSRVERMCWDIYRGGTELQRRVTDWALENLPMLRLLPNRPKWLYVSYEELVTSTDSSVAYVAENLQLPDRARMTRRVTRPSRSTRRESTAERQAMIAQGNSHRLVDSWKEKVGAREIAQCCEILDAFEIDLYGTSTSLPDRNAVGREPLPQSETRVSDAEAGGRE